MSKLVLKYSPGPLPEKRSSKTGVFKTLTDHELDKFVMTQLHEDKSRILGPASELRELEGSGKKTHLIGRAS
jgi:hypothetical protein